jgi:4-azaleucine resistance transporter AzlC
MGTRPPIRFTLDGARRGALAMLPILPGAVAFGVLWGFLAGEKGLGTLEAVAMSALVFAGAAQFLALELWTEPLPVAAIVTAVLIVNLRHLLMGPVLQPWLRGLPPGRAVLSLTVMTDESWSASVVELRRGGRDAAFLPGAGLLLWAVWVAATLTGRALGDVGPLIRDWGLDYLTTAFFVALLAGLWRGRRDLGTWLVAGVVAVAAQAGLGDGWHILAGALAGSLAGAVVEGRRP